MKPGFGRAVGAGILGFLGAILFTIALRYLQGIEPVFDAEIAMILAAFVSSFAFVWGIGGTDPRMSQHPHEPEVDEETGLILYEEAEEEHDAHEEDESKLKPSTVLGYSMWSIAFYTVLLVVSLFAFANLPLGLFLQQSGDPNASAEAIGFFETELPILGEVVMSQLTLFVIVVIVTLVTLGVVGGGMAVVFTSLSRNLTEVREEKPTRLSYHSEREAARKPFMRDLIIALGVIGTYILLFDFMVRGSMQFTPEINLFHIAVAIALGGWLTLRRTKGVHGEDAVIEAVKVFSMSAALVFLFPVLYILHYEALVGLIFTTPIIRTLLSLGAAATLAPVLTFVLFNDTVSDIIIRSARSLRDNLRGEQAVDTQTTAIQPIDEQRSAEVAES